MKEKIIRMIHIVSACIPLLLMGLLIAHRILTGGGMLGFLPLIVLEVCIGQSIHTPGSPQFLLALGLRLALSLGSLLVYWRKFHKAAR